MHMPLLRPQWTADDLDSLPEDGNRYEIIDGELFVTPAPVLRHQYAVGELFALFRDYLRTERVGYAIVAPADVRFSTRNSVQPDVFVLPLLEDKRPESFGAVGRLLLAAEVLSPGTARSDRVKKRTLYREQNVPEYWIVDLDARTFERTTPDDPRPEVLAETINWHPQGASRPLVIDLVSYFAGVLEG